jgi:hypothetical protein
MRGKNSKSVRKKQRQAGAGFGTMSFRMVQNFRSAVLLSFLYKHHPQGIALRVLGYFILFFRLYPFISAISIINGATPL